MSGIEIKLFNPNFVIKKSKNPVIFIDTFMWYRIFASDELSSLLRKCCKYGKLTIIMTSFQEGEMSQRNLLEKVREISGRSILTLPIGYISANQVIHSMISYYENIKNVILSWSISISEVPILKLPKIDLKNIVNRFVCEMNKLINEIKKSKGICIPQFIQSERVNWMKALKVYWQLIPKFSKKYDPKKSYEEFFFSDYFTNLPSIVLRSYLFCYILREKSLKIQDVVDIYNISEVIPYTILSILDKDQHNRLLRLKKDYPQLFDELFKYVVVSSSHNKAFDPDEALKSFLEWCLKIE